MVVGFDADGLVAEGIPLLARVVTIADSFDAMTSDRPYRKGLPAEAAFDEMQKQSGRQFDPDLVEKFVATSEGGYRRAIHESDKDGENNRCRRLRVGRVRRAAAPPCRR